MLVHDDVKHRCTGCSARFTLLFVQIFMAYLYSSKRKRPFYRSFSPSNTARRFWITDHRGNIDLGGTGTCNDRSLVVRTLLIGAYYKPLELGGVLPLYVPMYASQGSDFNLIRRTKHGNIFSSNYIGKTMVKVTGPEYVKQVSVHILIDCHY